MPRLLKKDQTKKGKIPDFHESHKRDEVPLASLDVLVAYTL